MAKKCKAKKANGERCSAWALPGRDHCWAHDPSTKKKRDQARKLGGRARKYKQVDPPGTVSTIEDVLQGINAVLMRAWARDNSEKNDRILLAAYAAAADIIRPSEVEERLDAIEKRLGLAKDEEE